MYRGGSQTGSGANAALSPYGSAGGLGAGLGLTSLGIGAPVGRSYGPYGQELSSANAALPVSRVRPNSYLFYIQTHSLKYNMFVLICMLWFFFNVRVELCKRVLLESLSAGIWT